MEKENTDRQEGCMIMVAVFYVVHLSVMGYLACTMASSDMLWQLAEAAMLLTWLSIAISLPRSRSDCSVSRKS